MEATDIVDRCPRAADVYLGESQSRHGNREMPAIREIHGGQRQVAENENH